MHMHITHFFFFCVCVCVCVFPSCFLRCFLTLFPITRSGCCHQDDAELLPNVSLTGPWPKVPKEADLVLLRFSSMFKTKPVCPETSVLVCKAVVAAALNFFLSFALTLWLRTCSWSFQAKQLCLPSPPSICQSFFNNTQTTLKSAFWSWLWVDF